MADIVSASERSRVMSLVRSRGNKSTELRLIALFREMGLKGWRRNYPVNGKPDFVFLKKRVAVFADGCFWHGHSCRNLKPASNTEYWTRKINRNMERDREVEAIFVARGWRVVRIWECELRHKGAKAKKKLEEAFKEE
ncbi:MAG: very short patch repair endonuclease [Desulfovibrio sp.]|nr:very short patch repair endonuclease [Desulfovibrio sp.]